jgi:hypothetical protein
MNRKFIGSGVAMAVAAGVACGAPQAPLTNEPPAASALASPMSSVAASSSATAAGSPGSLDRIDAGAAGPARLTSQSFALPGAEGPVSLDFITYERANARIWVPVGTTGSVDVFDTARGSFTRVDGFATAEKDMRGKKRILGPSSAAIGEGVVYIGNRASSEICPVDTKTLKRGACIKLSSPPDCVAYLASVREVWVTTPKDQTLTILDASKPESLKAKTIVKTDGAAEGYAIDEADGLFFTNLEDKGGTLAIDIKTRKVKATWNAGCATDGPRGVAFDAAHDLVVVACTDHLQVLDAAHDGALLGTLDTGAGVDNLDIVDGTAYVAAGKAARLTMARIDDKGRLAIVAAGETAR